MSDVNHEYIEDRRYILTFIDDQKKINDKLFTNDEELKIALSKLVTKMGVITAGTSIIIGVAVSYISKVIG